MPEQPDLTIGVTGRILPGRPGSVIYIMIEKENSLHAGNRMEGFFICWKISHREISFAVRVYGLRFV